MKGDAEAIASAAIAATDREIHVIIRGNYHDAPSMQQQHNREKEGSFPPFPGQCENGAMHGNPVPMPQSLRPY